MKRPNFFIIGAPKCATTSLAAWLSEHPQVYLSPLKEPYYFNRDHGGRRTRSIQDYEALFKNASEERHLAVGEASVWSLYSKVAVKNILDEVGESARMIVMLRNPLEMAPALHQQKVFSLHEDIEDFESAWRAQNERRRGRLIKRKNVEPLQLVYGDACKLGEQVKRLYSLVPRENVLVILLDDLRANVASVYEKALTFLGIERDGRVEFPRKNEAKASVSTSLHKFVSSASRIKHRFGIYKTFGIGALNVKLAPRPAVSPELRDEMVAVFRDDVALLAKLLDRDLDHWLTR